MITNPMNTHVLMVDNFHQFEFTVCSLSMGDILKWTWKLLDGNILFRLSVKCSTVTFNKEINTNQDNYTAYHTTPWAPDPMAFRFWYLLRMVNLVSPTSTVWNMAIDFSGLTGVTVISTGDGDVSSLSPNRWLILDDQSCEDCCRYRLRQSIDDPILLIVDAFSVFDNCPRCSDVYHSVDIIVGRFNFPLVWQFSVDGHLIGLSKDTERTFRLRETKWEAETDSWSCWWIQVYLYVVRRCTDRWSGVSALSQIFLCSFSDLSQIDLWSAENLLWDSVKELFVENWERSTFDSNL